MDPNEKLRKLLDQSGWTEYRLARKAGLSDSTIINIFKRNTVPSIPTLEAICRGFGITLSQFFAEGEMVEITPELQEIFRAWLYLTPEQKEALLHLLDTMRQDHIVNDEKKQ
ncbi:MAG: helix-turn-helix transcriptional regulator [Ruminococcaceae bacterium]|nr:helix-turn-helix transcriptional regulator [Oscillospiraceae bacterium]